MIYLYETYDDTVGLTIPTRCDRPLRAGINTEAYTAVFGGGLTFSGIGFKGTHNEIQAYIEVVRFWVNDDLNKLSRMLTLNALEQGNPIEVITGRIGEPDGGRDASSAPGSPGFP